jgi:hypothetical protein
MILTRRVVVCRLSVLLVYDVKESRVTRALMITTALITILFTK